MTRYLRPRTQPEANIKDKIRRYLENQNIYFINIQEGFGTQPGHPDIVICYKGQFIGVEGKAGKGTQRSEQKIQEQRIIANGGIYLLVYSLEDFIQKFTEAINK